MPKLAIYPSTRGLSSIWKRFSTCFVRQNQQKTTFFLRGDFTPLRNKNVSIWDHFFPLLFPKNSESLKILDIRLREVGAKRRLNGTSKVKRRTDTRTDTQTFRPIESIGPEGRCFENAMEWNSTFCKAFLYYVIVIFRTMSPTGRPVHWVNSDFNQKLGLYNF